MVVNFLWRPKFIRTTESSQDPVSPWLTFTNAIIASILVWSAANTKDCLAQSSARDKDQRPAQLIVAKTGQAGIYVLPARNLFPTGAGLTYVGPFPGLVQWSFESGRPTVVFPGIMFGQGVIADATGTKVFGQFTTSSGSQVSPPPGTGRDVSPLRCSAPGAVPPDLHEGPSWVCRRRESAFGGDRGVGSSIGREDA